MNRMNSIRHLALSIVLAGLSVVGAAGCFNQATEDEVSTDEASSRNAHYVAAPRSRDDSETGDEHLLNSRQFLIRLTSGNNQGPRPEPWLEDGEANGPRPEPWTPRENDDSSGGSGSTPPPTTSTSTSTSSSSSSSGNPANPNSSSK